MRFDQTRIGITFSRPIPARVDRQFGIRIEDTVLVTENGCQILTPTSKELVRL